MKEVSLVYDEMCNVDFAAVEKWMLDYLKEKKMEDEDFNKYYVGSNKVFIRDSYGKDRGKHWVKDTLEEAVEHAKRILEEEQDKEYTFVVKIVRVIRRQKQPMVVTRID